MQVRDINHIKERIDRIQKIGRINVYENHINPKNKLHAVKVLEFRPYAGKDFGDQIDHFEKTTPGHYTFEFMPGGEFHHVSTLKAGEIPQTLNGTENMQNMGIPTEEMIQAQVQKILENERLKMRVQQLEEEADANDMWGQRFGAALNMIIDRFIPGQTQTMQAEQSLNGTDLNSTEAALVILVENFGEEWLQKFAAKVQNDPGLVKQIKAFFS